ncbi:hypothetical protein EZS27_006088 [termite gut metagenome]|uniref:Phage protein n=1 Tax=termite gut metagenome TaxID=433724 RepID=A0A5J4SKH8_9ZZZZ
MEKEIKEITQQQIDEWKAKWGSVYLVEIEEKKAYLRKPDRKALSAAAVVGKNDPIKYNEILLTNCWLGGDEVIKTDDSYFLGISGKLSEIIEIKEAELKKL